MATKRLKPAQQLMTSIAAMENQADKKADRHSDSCCEESIYYAVLLRQHMQKRGHPFQLHLEGGIALLCYPAVLNDPQGYMVTA